MIKKSPTAINKHGNKINRDGYVFDSEKEDQFYRKFVKNCGYRFEVHPSYLLQELTQIPGTKKTKISAISYKPDFVIYDEYGQMIHVYDVKNSFGVYGIDQGNKLRFRLFAARYGVPVEAVVILAHEFKTIAQGVTKPLNDKDPLHKTDFNYSWIEATNY